MRFGSGGKIVTPPSDGAEPCPVSADLCPISAGGGLTGQGRGPHYRSVLPSPIKHRRGRTSLTVDETERLAVMRLCATGRTVRRTWAVELRPQYGGTLMACYQCSTAGKPLPVRTAAARPTVVAHLAGLARQDALPAHLRTCQCHERGCPWHPRAPRPPTRSPTTPQAAGKRPGRGSSGPGDAQLPRGCSAAIYHRSRSTAGPAVRAAR